MVARVPCAFGCLEVNIEATGFVNDGKDAGEKASGGGEDVRDG